MTILWQLIFVKHYFRRILSLLDTIKEMQYKETWPKQKPFLSNYYILLFIDLRDFNFGNFYTYFCKYNQYFKSILFYFLITALNYTAMSHLIYTIFIIFAKMLNAVYMGVYPTILCLISRLLWINISLCSSRE